MVTNWTHRRHAVVGVIVCVWVSILSPPAAAQFRPARPFRAPKFGVEAVNASRPQNLQLEQLLREATRAIENQQWDDAIGRLQTIINAPSDAYPKQERLSQPASRSVKQQAVDLLTTLPETGRSAYVKRFDIATAAAIDAIDATPDQRRRLALRFRWTPNGWRELFRQAAHAIDLGQPRRAAAWLAVLPDNVVPNLEPARDARRQLIDTLLARPEFSRLTGRENATASVVSHTPWRVELLESDRVGQNATSFTDAVQNALDAWNGTRSRVNSTRFAVEPFLMNDLVLTAGFGEVRAYDAFDGVLRWRSSVADQAWTYLSRRARTSPELSAVQRDLWTLERLFADRTHGTLSGDGDVVFAILDGGSSIWNEERPTAVPHPLMRSESNRLVAFEASTGRLLWWNGGVAVTSRPAPLAGVYFLGPPTIVAERAYVLGEIGQQVTLYELEPSTGDVLSSHPLWNRPSDFMTPTVGSPAAGIRPLAIDGRLLIAFDDVVIAYDCDRRQLLWTASSASPAVRYQFQTQSPFTDSSNSVIGDIKQLARESWRRPLVADDRLVTCSATHLTCFGVTDGRVIWQQPSERTSWLDTATVNVLIAVTERGLRGVDLRTGQTLWQRQLLGICGPAVRRGENATWPLWSGDLVTIRLATGDVVTQTPTSSGQRLGTATATPTHTAAVTGRELIGWAAPLLPAFDSVAPPVEQVATMSLDERTTWGLWAVDQFHRGRTDGLFAFLSALQKANPEEDWWPRVLASAAISVEGPLTRERLRIVKSLDLNTLPKSTAALFYQRLANEAQQRGDVAAEVDRLVQWIALGPLPTEQTLAPERTVNQRQVAVARLDRLVKMLPEKTLASLRDEWTKRLTTTSPKDDPETLSFDRSELSGRLPASLLTPEAAVAIASASKSLLRRETALRELLDERDDLTPNARDDALRTLAKLYAESDRPHDLKATLDELSDASTAWRDTFSARRDVARLLDSVLLWPDGPVEVRQRTTVGRHKEQQPLPRRQRGPGSRTVVDWAVSKVGADVFLYSPGVRPRGSFSLLESGLMDNGMFRYVETVGHMAVIVRRDSADVIDVLSHPPQLLGHVDLNPGASRNENVGTGGFTIMLNTRETVYGLQGLLSNTFSNVPLGNVGPLTPKLWTVLQDDRLTALDPLRPNAEPLWSVRGIAPGSELFGDRDVVLVKPRQGLKLLGFDTRDGSPIPVRDLPADVWRQRISDRDTRPDPVVGRCVITLSPSNATPKDDPPDDGAPDDRPPRVVTLFDPVTGDTRWSRDVPTDAELIRVDETTLVVAAASGSVTLLDLTDGRELATADIPPMTATDRNRPTFYAESDGERVFVFGFDPGRGVENDREDNDTIAPIPGAFQPWFGSRMPIASGPAVAFDRQAEKTLWTRDVVNQRVPPGQPDNWPFVLLASTYLGPATPLGTPRERSSHVALLDKQTGETLWSDEALPYDLAMSWESRFGRKPGTRLRFNAFELQVTPAEPEPEKSPSDTEDRENTPAETD